MKPAPFDYHDPKTVDEALRLLEALPDARLLAGGQSLMPMMNMRLVQPAHVIDLNRVRSLSYIRLDGNALEIGAMTRQREIEASEVVRRAFPLIHEAVRHIGHRQTRNRGTLGGSLCQLDPSAELVTVAAAADAAVLVAAKAGTREIRFRDFPRGLMTTALGPQEIVTAVRFPLWASGHLYGFDEFARRHGDFALASAAVLMETDGARIVRARITIGGIAPAPQELALPLQGRTLSPALADEVGAACEGMEAMDDPHIGAAYRRRVAAAVARRATEKALGQAAH